MLPLRLGKRESECQLRMRRKCMLLQMSGPLRAPLAVEILLLLKLSQKLFNNLKLVVQSKTQSFLNDLVQRSLAEWISLYMEQTGNRADVRCAFA